MIRGILAAILAIIFFSVLNVGTRLHSLTRQAEREPAPHWGRTLVTHPASDPNTTIYGAEDLQIDHATGFVYVSATDRRSETGTGALYRFQLDDPAGSLVQLDAAPSTVFRPHGISLYDDGAGTKRLFVVNHLGTLENPIDTVEVFTVDESDDVDHLTTHPIEQPAQPNDVVGVSPTQFYVTNTDYYAGLMPGYPYIGNNSKVMYFDGSTFHTVLENQHSANGINVSADGRTIYIADALLQSLSAYSRDPETGELSDRVWTPLGSWPDNIDVAADGTVWIATSPRFWNNFRHSVDINTPLPSEVLRVDPANDYTVTHMFASGPKDPAHLSRSSVGAFHDGTLVVSSYLNAGVLICRESPSG